MKKTLCVLALAAASALLAPGCSSSGGQSDAVTETAFENQIASTIGFDPGLVQVGERVVYFVKRVGDTQTQRYIWSAVAEEGTAVWVETKLPNDPRPPFVVKTKIDRSGKVLEEWVGEPGGVPGRSKLGGSGPKPVRDSSTAKSDTKEEPDKITVLGKPYDCTRVTTVLSYPDGRKSTMINWFSKEVPFAASKALGGLVKRQFGRLTMELVAGDHNAKSELVIPPPEK
jgi:hypothetical protein